MPGLGRIYKPDVRDRDFLMNRKLGEVTAVPVGAKLYPVKHVYDQGQTPQCVGYSCSGVMTAMEEPATVVFNATHLYDWANAHDGDPSAHEGSTVRAGLQGLLTVGDMVVTSTDAEDPPNTADKVANYLWADTTKADGDVNSVITWLLTISPVVIGIDWYNDAFHPDAKGYIHLTGGVAGGHAIMVRGVNATDPNNIYFVLRNSWNGWGVTVHPDWTVTADGGGDCLISSADLVKLLIASGEAGAVVEALAPAPTPKPTPKPKPPTDPRLVKIINILSKAMADIKKMF